MATQAGTLLTAIGSKLDAATTGYTIRYGAPDASGMRTGFGKYIYVRYVEETETVGGNQLGGVCTVTPRIMIHLEQPYTGDSTDDDPHLALLELASDLRLAIGAMVLDNATGTAAISGWPVGAALWVTDCTTSPATLDIGAGQSTESVTLVFGFKFTRTFGGR